MKINEIFYSIQGESSFAGLPCIFIRLTGCNLRCQYCDTKYAYLQGYELTIDEILTKISPYKCNLVEITGGEPLLQPQTIELAKILINKQFHVLIETNGSQDISVLPPQVIRIMDIKCPGSGEVDNMDWENIKRLNSNDEIKFIICNREDFDWAVTTINKYKLVNRLTILFSTTYDLLKPETLAQWILDSHLPIKLQLQLHKYLSLK